MPYGPVLEIGGRLPPDKDSRAPLAPRDHLSSSPKGGSNNIARILITATIATMIRHFARIWEINYD